MLTIGLLVTGHVDIARPLDDPFQEAEYAISRPQLQPPAVAGQPVLIHGGLDQVPATLAAAACPADRQIGCIRTINFGFQLLAAGLLIAATALIGGLGTWAAALACLPTMLILIILGGTTATPVAGQQAVPGIRDLPVLLALFPMLSIARRLDAGPQRQAREGWPALALLGALAAAGPFWTYNRGAVLIVMAGAFTLAVSFLRRSAVPALIVLGGGCLGLAVILVAFGPTEIMSTVQNIVYWGQNGALWRVPPVRSAVAVTLLFYAMSLAGLAVGWVRNRPSPGHLVLCGTLLGIGGLYILQSMDRADAAHLRWALWPATLILAAGIAHLVRHAPMAWRVIVPSLALAAITALAAAFLAEPPRHWDIRSGWAANISTAQQGWPNDRSIAGPALDRVADQVRAAGVCTFAANNAGMVHLLSGMPPCLRFAFGAYIAPDRQDEVIATLAATQPAIILWDGPGWWAHIDGRPFTARAPAVAAWITRTYPVETSIQGYVLRSKAPLPLP